ncbi:hypothetical protein EU84_13400 [Staphylococcus aureus]|nr:hypothetical protein HMPREF9529_02786 [Staphylococcus aureus subsp. aureus MRSA177]EWR92897.1 hypothetical protein T865_01071 [Staphylococcus aureus SJOS6123]EYQ25479.1 hypothetical protein W253_00267 [Staphylococcus aureus DAR1937]KMR19711.1 hypothetical protein EU84_13400 [Staphylococcus aureus]KOS64977.1 hypothetical protein AN169_14640 [Staphylococcus aureus]
MNNEELEMRLLLMKQSIEQLQEELAPNLKTRDLVLLRYMYSYKEINMLDSYLFQLATNKEQITKNNLKQNWKTLEKYQKYLLDKLMIY